jgi:hypothetical protein
MSTKDQLLYSALHGTAMRCATERRNLDESIEELRQIADGRDDILTKAAGITAGSWYAWPSTHVGHELIAAGMLILVTYTIRHRLPASSGAVNEWQSQARFRAPIRVFYSSTTPRNPNPSDESLYIVGRHPAQTPAQAGPIN